MASQYQSLTAPYARSPYIPLPMAPNTLGNFGSVGSAVMGSEIPTGMSMGNFNPELGGFGSGDTGFQLPEGSGGITGAMSTVADKAGGGLFSNFLGTKDAPGWGNMALGAIGGLAQGYMGMKQYGLAKEQLAEGKRQYNQNYAAQKTTTNASLEDRQRARVASNAGAYESVGSYMNKNGIK